MKVHILILFASFAVYTYALDQAIVDEVTTKIEKYALECIDSEKPTPEDVEALMKRVAPITRAGRCVLFCVSKKLDLMTEDGKVSDLLKSDLLEKIKANDPESYDKMNKLHDICKEKVNPAKDGCDVSLELMSCSKYEGQKLGINKFLY